MQQRSRASWAPSAPLGGAASGTAASLLNVLPAPAQQPPAPASIPAPYLFLSPAAAQLVMMFSVLCVALVQALLLRRRLPLYTWPCAVAMVGGACMIIVPNLTQASPRGAPLLASLWGVCAFVGAGRLVALAACALGFSTGPWSAAAGQGGNMLCLKQGLAPSARGPSGRAPPNPPTPRSASARRAPRAA